MVDKKWLSVDNTSRYELTVVLSDVEGVNKVTRNWWNSIDSNVYEKLKI